MGFNSLSGRFLLLTTAFFMLAEVLIFVPSIARFREDYLRLRLERAQIAALATLATDQMISADLETELLTNAGVFNVVLRRDSVRQLVLSSPLPQPVDASFDLRQIGAFGLIGDALWVFANPENRVIRVIGNPVRDAGLLIEVTMETAPLRVAMIDYGLRIFGLSAIISLMAGFVLFIAVRRLLVSPIERVVTHMKAYAQSPEDARRVITPTASVRELREAEEALQSLQTQLTGALRQRARLAQLGSAVAKISHDLRNMLSTAQLIADRMDTSLDPAVARAAPKLINSIARAVNLCESTLAFGQAQEPPPRLSYVLIGEIIDDVIESEQLALADDRISLRKSVPAGLMIRADAEQIFRVLSNLARNARQAIEASAKPGIIEMTAGEDTDSWWVSVRDDGPGLPAKARENLFTAFQGGARKGGVGLGLAISADLVRGHGGQLQLVKSSPDETVFLLRLPKNDVLTEPSLYPSDLVTM